MKNKQKELEDKEEKRRQAVLAHRKQVRQIGGGKQLNGGRRGVRDGQVSWKVCSTSVIQPGISPSSSRNCR